MADSTTSSDNLYFRSWASPETVASIGYSCTVCKQDLPEVEPHHLQPASLTIIESVVYITWKECIRPFHLHCHLRFKVADSGNNCDVSISIFRILNYIFWLWSFIEMYSFINIMFFYKKSNPYFTIDLFSNRMKYS